MYLWIWRHLPAKNPAMKALIALVLIALVAAVLWYGLFPWLEPRIRFDHGTVNDA
jgi:hypothetical protein